MSYIVKLTPYIQLLKLEEKSEEYKINCCVNTTCSQYEIKSRSEFCGHCGSKNQVKTKLHDYESYPDAYDFCEEHLPEEYNEFFIPGMYDSSIWTINRYLSKEIEELIHIDNNNNALLDMSSFDGKKLIEMINDDNDYKQVKKALDKELGSENYELRLGIFTEYS